MSSFIIHLSFFQRRRNRRNGRIDSSIVPCSVFPCEVEALDGCDAVVRRKELGDGNKVAAKAAVRVRKETLVAGGPAHLIARRKEHRITHVCGRSHRRKCARTRCRIVAKAPRKRPQRTLDAKVHAAAAHAQRWCTHTHARRLCCCEVLRQCIRIHTRTVPRAHTSF